MEGLNPKTTSFSVSAKINTSESDRQSTTTLQIHVELTAHRTSQLAALLNGKLIDAIKDYAGEKGYYNVEVIDYTCDTATSVDVPDLIKELRIQDPKKFPTCETVYIDLDEETRPKNMGSPFAGAMSPKKSDSPSKFTGDSDRRAAKSPVASNPDEQYSEDEDFIGGSGYAYADMRSIENTFSYPSHNGPPEHFVPKDSHPKHNSKPRDNGFRDCRYRGGDAQYSGDPRDNGRRNTDRQPRDRRDNRGPRDGDRLDTDHRDGDRPNGGRRDGGRRDNRGPPNGGRQDADRRDGGRRDNRGPPNGGRQDAGRRDGGRRDNRGPPNGGRQDADHRDGGRRDGGRQDGDRRDGGRRDDTVPKFRNPQNSGKGFKKENRSQGGHRHYQERDD
jgi:hypothetical protein